MMKYTLILIITIALHIPASAQLMAYADAGKSGSIHLVTQDRPPVNSSFQISNSHVRTMNDCGTYMVVGGMSTLLGGGISFATYYGSDNDQGSPYLVSGAVLVGTGLIELIIGGIGYAVSSGYVRRYSDRFKIIVNKTEIGLAYRF